MVLCVGLEINKPICGPQGSRLELMETQFGLMSSFHVSVLHFDFVCFISNSLKYL